MWYAGRHARPAVAEGFGWQRQHGTELQRLRRRRSRAILREAVPLAAEVLVACLDAPDPALRMRAAVAILNRAGLTEAGRLEVSEAAVEVGGRPVAPEDSMAVRRRHGLLTDWEHAVDEF